MKDINLTLPWPPSVNKYKRVGRITRTKSGKVYQTRVNSNTTKMFYYQVWLHAKAIYGYEGSPFFQQPDLQLGINVKLYPPDNYRRDIDNVLKTLFDSLQRAKLIADDYQFCRLFVQRMSVLEGGRTDIHIYPADSI